MPSLKVLFGAALLSFAVLGACSSQSTNVVCQNDDTSTCEGDDGCDGTRECRDGSWTVCMCEGDVDGAGGSGGANSTTSPSGGAGTVDGTTSTSGGSGGDGGVGGSTGTSDGSNGSGGSSGSGGSGGSSASGTTGTAGTTGTTGTDTGGSGGGPVDDTVRGTVVNHWLHPVSGVTVLLGDQEVQTNAQGEFEFADVPETYDVMLDVTYQRYGGTARYGWVYQGVKRRDPTLQVYGGLALRSSNIFINPINVTAGTGRVVVTALGGDYGRYAREGDSAVYTSLSYFGPPSITMYAHALQWVQVDDLPVDYVAYDNSGLLAFDSEVSDEVEVEVDLTETEVASGTISGVVASPSSDDRRNAVYVRFASNALIQVVNDSPRQHIEFHVHGPGVTGCVDLGRGARG